MIVIVRDEDPPTVAAAINAYADEEGLEPVDLAGRSQNPFEMLGVLAGPRVIVAMSEDQVVVRGLESLDVAEPEEWGSNLSAACESEVIAIDATEAGLSVWVFDGGELDETIEVPFDASKKKTLAPKLAEFAESAAGREELETGVAGSTIADVLDNVLRCLGAASPDKDSVIMLAFIDPLDEEGEGGEKRNPDEACLIVQPLPAASLEGKVNGPVTSVRGTVFGVTIVGVPEIEGVRLSLSGDALGLFTIDEVEIDLRLRGSLDIVRRGYKVDDATKKEAKAAGDKGELVLDLSDAFLESMTIAPPTIDMTDLFSSVQRMMSASSEQASNTIAIQVIGTGVRAGEGTLTLTAVPIKDEDGEKVAGSETSIPVRIN